MKDKFTLLFEKANQTLPDEFMTRWLCGCYGALATANDKEIAYKVIERNYNRLHQQAEEMRQEHIEADRLENT